MGMSLALLPDRRSNLMVNKGFGFVSEMLLETCEGEILLVSPS